MLTQQAMRGRVAIVLAGVTIALIAAAATYHRDTSADLAGSWDLTVVDGHKLDARGSSADQMISFELRPDGTFSMPPASGKWTVEGSNLLLHTNIYDGKTKQQFHDEVAAKHPDDPSMQSIAEKVFEDLKYTIDADGASLTANLGGGSQTYTKRRSK